PTTEVLAKECLSPSRSGMAPHIVGLRTKSVYNLECQSASAFLAGRGSLLVHNTSTALNGTTRVDGLLNGTTRVDQLIARIDATPASLWTKRMRQMLLPMLANPNARAVLEVNLPDKISTAGAGFLSREVKFVDTILSRRLIEGAKYQIVLNGPDLPTETEIREGLAALRRDVRIGQDSPDGYLRVEPSPP